MNQAHETACARHFRSSDLSRYLHSKKNQWDISSAAYEHTTKPITGEYKTKPQMAVTILPSFSPIFVYFQSTNPHKGQKMTKTE